QDAGRPPEDLPMPSMMDSVTAETPVTPVSGAAAEAPPMEAAATAATSAPVAAVPPSRAETAIVENAAMLDQLSAPATGTAADPAARGKTVSDILGGEPAVVRPLPDSYVVVQKDHSAGALSTRLKVARMALVEGRNAAALQLFNDIHADYPRDERVSMGRALALQKLGQRDQALLAHEQILADHPKHP